MLNYNMQVWVYEHRISGRKIEHYKIANQSQVDWIDFDASIQFQNLEINASVMYLFKTVDDKVLKSENIQNTNVMKRFGALQRHIELADNPLEQLGIEGHGQRVTRILGISDLQWGGDGLSSHLTLYGSQSFSQPAGFNLQLRTTV